jgi:ribonuclease HII
MPDFFHETRFPGIIAGVDEVGRGPLAGPVLAAAAILPRNLPATLASLIDDSKKLSPAKRVLALEALRLSGAHIVLGAASVTEIAHLNILHASLLAMRRAVARLPVRPDYLLIDGNRDPGADIPAQLIIGGDAISLSIAAASIAAKIARDSIMARLHLRYPAYAWNKNAGYAAPAHRAAILSNGPTPHHRIGFGPLLRG